MASTRQKDVLAMLNDRYERSAKAQQDVFEEFEQARLFYRGDQWIYYNNGWRTAPIPRWRVRLTVNKLIPMVDLLVSTATRVRPIITARPRTDDEDDRRSAKVGEMLLRYYWDLLDFDVNEIRKLKYVFVEGNVFQVVDWDHEQQRPRVDLVPPYSFGVEPGAVTLEDAGWAMVTELSRIDELELRYNQKIERTDLKEDLKRAYVPVLLDRQEEVDLEERTVFQRYYERPSRKHPRGRLVTRAGNTVVAEDDLPVEDPDSGAPQFPIVHFKGIELLGEFWATSPVSQSIPLQQEVNRSRSQLIENRNLCGRPQLLAAQNSIEEDSYTNEPGAIIWWDPVLARQVEPHYMNPPQVPGWVMNIMATAEQDMYDLVGRHEVSQGQMSNVSSGRQAAILRQADDSRWAPMIRQYQHGLKKLGQLLLQFAQKNLSGDQVLNIVGRGRESEVFYFSSNSISARVNIQFDIESQLPWTKESMRQMAMQLFDKGQMDQDTLHQIMEIPSPDKMYEPQQDHLLNARRENQLLEDTYFPPVPGDNDQLHILEHTRYVCDPTRREAIIQQMELDKQKAALVGQAPPPVPSIIRNHLQHLEEHRKRLPQPEPPPPAPKVNLGLDRLIRDMMQVRPELAERLMPYVEEILQDSLNSQNPQQPSGPPPKGMRAPAASMGAEYGGQQKEESTAKIGLTGGQLGIEGR